MSSSSTNAGYLSYNLTTEMNLNISSGGVDEYKSMRGPSIVGFVLTLIIFIVGFLGNLLQFLSISLIKTLKKTENMLIASLAVNNNLYLILHCPMVLYIYINFYNVWDIGTIACLMTRVIIFTALAALCLFHILAITVIRFLMIIKPLWYLKINSTKFMVGLIAALYGATFLMVFGGVFVPPIRRKDKMVFDTLFMYCRNRSADNADNGLGVAAMYCVLLLIIGLLYLVIYLKVQKTTRAVRASTSTNAISINVENKAEEQNRVSSNMNNNNRNKTVSMTTSDCASKVEGRDESKDTSVSNKNSQSVNIKTTDGDNSGLNDVGNNTKHVSNDYMQEKVPSKINTVSFATNSKPDSSDLRHSYNRKLSSVNGQNKKDKINIKREAAIAKTTVVILLCYIILYLPWPIVLELHVREIVTSEWVVMPVMMMYICSYCANWILYGAMNKNFSRAYKQIVCRKRKYESDEYSHTQTRVN